MIKTLILLQVLLYIANTFINMHDSIIARHDNGENKNYVLGPSL